MIIGECPYCKGGVMTPIAPGQLPKFSKETCENCGKEYWLKHSRVDPVAYSLDSVEVDEKTRIVKVLTPNERE